MLHSDFITELDRRDAEWGIRRIGPALRVGFGVVAAMRYRLVLLILLLPGLILAAYAIISAHRVFLVWSILALMGFRSSSTRPTGIGMITCLLLAITGCVVFLYARDWLHLAGGLLPGITWFGACAAKGVALGDIETKLRHSREYYERLVSSGNLESRQRANV